MSRGSTMPPKASWPFAAGESPFRMKGVGYRTFMADLDKRLGLSRVAEAIDDPALRDFIRQPFLAASWYDVGPVVPLNRVAGELLGRTPIEMYVERTRVQADEDLAGVYSFVLSVLSPMAVAKTLPRLTARYFDWGGVEIVEHGPRDVSAFRTGVPAYLTEWYEHVSVEYMRVALSKAGARSLTFEVSSVPDAAAHGVDTRKMRFRIGWA